MPTDKLIPRLTGLNARLGDLYTRFGDPRYVKPVPDGVTYANCVLDLQGVQTVIRPNPKIVPISTVKRVSGLPSAGQYLSENVMITGDEWLVSDISREYSDALLSNARYILWATFNTGAQTWEGTRADCEFLDRTLMMTFTAVVRPYRKR